MDARRGCFKDQYSLESRKANCEKFMAANEDFIYVVV